MTRATLIGSGLLSRRLDLLQRSDSTVQRGSRRHECRVGSPFRTYRILQPTSDVCLGHTAQRLSRLTVWHSASCPRLTHNHVQLWMLVGSDAIAPSFGGSAGS